MYLGWRGQLLSQKSPRLILSRHWDFLQALWCRVGTETSAAGTQLWASLCSGGLQPCIISIHKPHFLPATATQHWKIIISQWIAMQDEINPRGRARACSVLEHGRQPPGILLKEVLSTLPLVASFYTHKFFFWIYFYGYLYVNMCIWERAVPWEHNSLRLIAIIRQK